MRSCYFIVALLGACASTAAHAELKMISFVHLATDEPDGGNALYSFSFSTSGKDFIFARVYFNLASGARYGCGVYANTSCTLQAAGQTLKLIGLANGVQGSFSWYENAAGDNRPTGIDIGVPNDPSLFRSVITEPLAIPEPATWSLMTAGFGLLGYGVRRRTLAVSI
jgi:hypothetical protein